MVVHLLLIKCSMVRPIRGMPFRPIEIDGQSGSPSYVGLQ